MLFKDFKNFLSPFAPGFAFFFLLSASSHSAEPKTGGTLRFGVRNNLRTLNPFHLMQSVDHRVRSLVYENLLAYDRNLEPMPSLAGSWGVSPDGMTYTFTVRPGVRFHNRKPLSPDDIKWSLEYAQNPKNHAYGREDLTIVDKVEVEPGHIRVRLKSPFTPFLSAVANIQLFPVVAKGSLQTGETQRDSLPPGTGPFRFASWKPGQELRVQRFTEYWQKGLPYLEEVHFLIVPDNTVRMNAIRAGDLDIVEEVPRVEVTRIRDGKMPGIGLVIAPAGTTRRIIINHCRPPFNNLKVRQALALAIDQQDIIDGAYSGHGTPANQKLLRGNKWFVTELPERKQDLARARALLAEGGYPDGVKATINASTGTETELQIIQNQAKKAGIELSTRMHDAATQMAILAKGEYQLATAGANTASDPDLAYYSFYHTAPGEQRYSGGGRIQPCYSNPRVDQLLEDARRITDFRERRRMYKELAEILYDEVPDLLIGFIPNGFAFQRSIRDFEPMITGVYSYGNGGLLKTWIDR
jgi:peptide/nickel transport system substrate-binding protein